MGIFLRASQNYSESFIFSLVNKYYKPFTAKVLNDGRNAILNRADHGPVFGNGDLSIAAYSNNSQNSSSTLGNFTCCRNAWKISQF